MLVNTQMLTIHILAHIHSIFKIFTSSGKLEQKILMSHVALKHVFPSNFKGCLNFHPSMQRTLCTVMQEVNTILGWHLIGKYKSHFQLCQRHACELEYTVHNLT